MLEQALEAWGSAHEMTKLQALRLRQAKARFEKEQVKLAAIRELPIKERMNKAWTRMRAAGIFAQQNYWCCRTCAGAAACQTIEKRQSEGKTIVGCCYTTQQDYEVFKEDGLYDKEQQMLAFRQAIALSESGDVPQDYQYDGKPLTESNDRFRRLGRRTQQLLKWNQNDDGTLDVPELRRRLAYLVEHTGVYIGYSGVDQPDGTESDCKVVGRIVERALNECGVETVWDGSTWTRIYIPLLQDMVA